MTDPIRRLFGDRGSERGQAEALQHALERLERLRSRGIDEQEARREASAYLSPEARRLFSLSATVGDSAAAMPEPDLGAIEARLRAAASGASLLRQRPAQRRRTAVLSYAAAAACFVLVLGLLYGGARSLPGEPLYPVKRAAEGTRVALASGAAEGRLLVDLGDRRLDEVRSLVDRARERAIPLIPDTTVAAVGNISDPRLIALVDRTLKEAERNMEAAAVILIETQDAEGLERLEAVAHKGKSVANEVEAELPELDRPPVRDTAEKLERIEAQAKAARATVPEPEPSPTIGPCATPTPRPSPTPTPERTPTPEPTPTPSPTPTPDPDATPTPSPSPSPTPSPTPEPTPCVTPEPTAEPTPRPTTRPGTTDPTPEPEPEPTAAPDGEEPQDQSQPTPTPSPTPTATAADTTRSTSNDCGWVRHLFVVC